VVSVSFWAGDLGVVCVMSLKFAFLAIYGARNISRVLIAAEFLAGRHIKVNPTYEVCPEHHLRPAQKPTKTCPNVLKIKIPIVQNLYFLQNQAEPDSNLFMEILENSL
jgi:hypothetical protein